VKKGPNKKAGETGKNVRATFRFTEPRKAKFVGFVAETGRKHDSARRVGVSYATICLHARKDAAFAAAVEEALELHNDRIDEEIDRRGRLGISRDIWYQGVVVGREVNFSDRLLELRAKAKHPDYQDKLTVDQTTTVHGMVDMGIGDLDPVDRAALRALLEAKVKEKQQDEVVDVE